MIDPKILRQDLQRVQLAIKNRQTTFDWQEWSKLEEKRKSIQVFTQDLQNKRNALSKTIGALKKKGEDTQALMIEVTDIKQALEDAADELENLLSEQNHLQLSLPNLLHDSVPIGKSESDNVEVRRWGTPPTYTFTPKDHVALTEHSHLIDFQVATKMSGSRFVVMRGEIARLHRALTQFMLDTHTQAFGYQEVIVPYLVESAALFGSGQLPKFEEDLFHLKGDRALSLIPTAEVPLTNLVRDTILSKEQLPIKFVCHSACFRSEAGSYGKDTKGMIRQHQFEKVELVQVVAPEDSYDALEQLTGHAEAILKRLELPYRVVELCSADVGFCAAKTYDIEVWLPSQNCYREISSCSNTESFQARRLQARFRPQAESKPEYVHLLNGSGLAVGRTLIAVIENYQDERGNIRIPDVLLPYMNGVKQITV